MQKSNCKAILVALGGALFTMGMLPLAQGVEITTTDNQISTNSGKWTMVYDTTLPATLNPAGTSTSKGLYQQNIASTLNFSWLSVATAPYGIQTILPHTGSTTAILGLGSANNLAVADPLTVGEISSIDINLTARQTSTPNDSGMVAGLLIQDGKYYRTPWHVYHVFNSPYEPVSWTGLTASSFGKFVVGNVPTADGNPGDTNFSLNPDFSETGGQIQLGYLTGYDPSLGIADANNRSIVLAWSSVIRAGVLTPGDADGNGAVNSVDFDILLANYGKLSGATWAMGDFDADAKVTTTDFNLLAEHFGPPAAPLGATVPEPASLGVVGAAMLVTLRRRRA